MSSSVISVERAAYSASLDKDPPSAPSHKRGTQAENGHIEVTSNKSQNRRPERDESVIGALLPLSCRFVFLERVRAPRLWLNRADRKLKRANP